jgi:aldose 1-epimerase
MFRIVRGIQFVLVIIFLPAGLVAASEPKLAVEQETLKTLGGGEVIDRHTLTNGFLRVRVIDYGATLTMVETPDRDGKLANVSLYLDSIDDYLAGHPLFGSVVGRYANRIGGAKFTLDGVEYELEANAGPHHIHGGRRGFQRVVFASEPVRGDGSVGVRFSHTSPDGHAGFPGELKVTITYALNAKNELKIDYKATTDKPTVVNLTNHAYWNLAGAGSGDVLDQVLTINASHYLPTDAKKIPTGELRGVTGTVMDFSEPTAIGARIKNVEGENYDHCYKILREFDERLAVCAKALDPKSGRTMTVSTTKPGVQFYTAKGLGPRIKTADFEYGPYGGFCLETQHFPDSPNKPNFPSAVLRPGETYHHVTIHRFGVESPND